MGSEAVPSFDLRGAVRPAQSTSTPSAFQPCGLLGTLTFHPDVTFLVGENGTGKSTLLEAAAIAWGFNAEGGSKSFAFSTCPSHSELHRHLKLVRSFERPRDGFFLRAESFFNVASYIDGIGVAGAYGGRSLHEQSHGESFFTLVGWNAALPLMGNGLSAPAGTDGAERAGKPACIRPASGARQG